MVAWTRLVRRSNEVLGTRLLSGQENLISTEEHNAQMPSQIYPIWISNLTELDLVYEGQHLLSLSLNESSLQINRQIQHLNYELQVFLEEEMMDSDAAKAVANRLRDKRAILREISQKIERVHRLLRRLSDPSVPQELVDDYRERKKRESVTEIIRGQDKL